jgi:hypothetical protein
MGLKIGMSKLDELYRLVKKFKSDNKIKDLKDLEKQYSSHMMDGEMCELVMKEDAN